jgi:hypothetical protein
MDEIKGEIKSIHKENSGFGMVCAIRYAETMRKPEEYET